MSSSEEFSWISCFCAMRGNEFFCKVDEDYIQDMFNMTGLREQVPHYQKAINMILDLEPGDDSGDSVKQSEMVKQASELLYGLVHARYLLSIGGMMKMITKFKASDFGICPRVYCQNQAVLPIGLSDVPGEHMVKSYCPRCRDVYCPPNKAHRHTDGAFFGTSFPNMLFLTYPDLRPLPTKPNSFINYPDEQFVPRLFGFKIHPEAYELQQKAALNFKAPLRVLSCNWGKR